MRYVNLKKEARRDPYDTIISLGCGPNFVLNRRNAFEKMIKEQGVTFWFRFWLTFCFYPGCKDMKKIQEQYPQLRNSINIDIHRKFLQGSDDEAIKYSLDVAITQLQSPNKRSFPNENEDEQSFRELLLECSEMAFGANICALFYTWLTANKMNTKDQNYWTIPDEYLDAQFEPGMLEAFLMAKWKDNFLSLIDMNDKKKPNWLKKVYCGSLLLEEKLARQRGDVMGFQLLADYLKSHRDQKRFEIRSFDEAISIKKQREIGKLLLVNKLENDSHSPRCCGKIYKVPCHKTSLLRKLKRRQCAYCKDFEYIYLKFKKCKQCEEENWLNARYYCSDNCLVEHWFQTHQSEHNKWHGDGVDV